MSRVGKMPIVLPKNVNVACDHSTVEVAGPNGRLSCRLPQGITLSVDAG